MTADVAGGTATGTITLPDNSTVTVSFAAINQDSSPGNLYGAQTDGTGTNYWIPNTPYISTQVENPPLDTDILQLAGGQNQTYKVTLSEAIKDPIMAIVSLGAPGTTITYDFDSPFTIVSQGVGYWGGSDTALMQLPNNVLQGAEGHGTIQFIGTFSTFSWTVPVPETWHGFNFGIRTTERIEPTTDAGADAEPDDAADAGAIDSAEDLPAETAPEVAVEVAPEPTPEPTDAGVDVTSTKDAAADTGADAGTRVSSGGGCGCAIEGTPGGAAGGAAALVLLALLSRRRSALRRR
ncbi:MAG TPA: hypothetical protein VGL59_11995 [Polyangia bacterium]